MNPNNNHFEAPLNGAEQAQPQRRFSRAGWWFGMLPEHPEIHRLDHQLNPRIPAPNALAPEAYPNYYPPPPYYPHPGVIPAPDDHYGQPPAFGHYRPRPPAAEPVAQRIVARPEPTQVTVIVPLNTGVVGGIVTRVPLKLPADRPFHDFWDRVCAHMDLEPLEARLGYKITGDPARMEPYRLINEEDLRVAMGKVLEKVKRARTRDIVMEISNLHPAQRAASDSVGSASASKNRKRPASHMSQDDKSTSVSFLPQLRELRNRLECHRHLGKYCYVSLVNGEHRFLEVGALTL